MKNALIPVVTFIGLDLGAMLSGAVLTETVFNWPGIGFVIARRRSSGLPGRVRRDGHHSLAVMIINLLVDVTYAFLDPRIRYGGGSDRGVMLTMTDRGYSSRLLAERDHSAPTDGTFRR